MMIDRKTGHAPRAEALAREIAGLREPCVGCPGCTGLCPALIEALVLPDLLVGRG